MEVSKEEILHIAKLANLKIRDEEIGEYIKNLQDILNFANVVSKAPVDELNTAVGSINNYNVFRKDEVKNFENIKGLLEIAPEKKDNMFSVPKVLN